MGSQQPTVANKTSNTTFEFRCFILPPPPHSENETKRFEENIRLQLYVEDESEGRPGLETEYLIADHS